MMMKYDLEAIHHEILIQAFTHVHCRTLINYTMNIILHILDYILYHKLCISL